jgi:hypothetical protein
MKQPFTFFPVSGDGVEHTSVGHVREEVPSYGVRLGSAHIVGLHQLTRRVCSVESVAVDERQLTNARAGQRDCHPATEPAAANERYVRRFNLGLAVPWHCLLAAEQFRLGAVSRLRKPLGRQSFDGRRAMNIREREF